MDTKTTDMNKIDIVKPTPRKGCKGFGLSCSYWKQDTSHPSVNSDWSSENWDGNKAKAMEQNKSLIDFEALNQKTDTEKIMDVDEIPFSKLQIGQDSHKEEPLELTESLVLPPSTLATLEDTTKNTDKGLTEVKVKLQGEEEKFKMYDRIYVGLLTDEEDSDTKTNELTYTYFR